MPYLPPAPRCTLSLPSTATFHLLVSLNVLTTTTLLRLSGFFQSFTSHSPTRSHRSAITTTYALSHGLLYLRWTQPHIPTVAIHVPISLFPALSLVLTNTNPHARTQPRTRAKHSAPDKTRADLGVNFPLHFSLLYLQGLTSGIRLHGFGAFYQETPLKVSANFGSRLSHY
jgi:hypothetical protein